jgi:hypothetical protein
LLQCSEIFVSGAPLNTGFAPLEKNWLAKWAWR